MLEARCKHVENRCGSTLDICELLGGAQTHCFHLVIRGTPREAMVQPATLAKATVSLLKDNGHAKGPIEACSEDYIALQSKHRRKR